MLEIVAPFREMDSYDFHFKLCLLLASPQLGCYEKVDSGGRGDKSLTTIGARCTILGTGIKKIVPHVKSLALARVLIYGSDIYGCDPGPGMEERQR